MTPKPTPCHLTLHARAALWPGVNSGSTHPTTSLNYPNHAAASFLNVH